MAEYKIKDAQTANLDEIYFDKNVGKMCYKNALGIITTLETGTSGNVVQSVVAGTNVNVDNTYVYYNLLKENWDMFNYIEKVDWLRQEINNIFETWKTFHLVGLQMTQVLSFEQHIQEARFWLGFELQRIKENSK